ncbi:MAG: ABC transporter permease [Paracoccaceae bacterium]
MSLPVAARFAARELRGGLQGFRVLIACLALGVAAIAIVGTVRESIQEGLVREGATLLGGDAEIELTYRFATEDEKQWMADNADAVSEIVDFRSMAVVEYNGQTERGLTQVKAVDAVYPIYGEIQLEPDITLAKALDGDMTLPGAVMDPILVDRLRLSVGEEFRLGEQRFLLSAVLLREPDNSTAGFSFGPRTIVRASDLSGSGLLGPGTVFDVDYRLKLPAGSDLDAVKEAAEKAIGGGGFRWHDSRNGTPGVTRFVERLGTFLILVGLAGLAVGGVGVSAAVRAYLDKKVQVIATLKSLGADGRTIFQIYFIQIGVLTMLGIAIGLVLGALVPLLLAPLIEASLPVPVGKGIQFKPLAEAALYGFLAAVLFSVWPISRTENVRVATLYRDAFLGLAGWPRWRYIAFSAFVLALLVGSAAYFTGQTRLTLWASVGIIGAFVLLVAMANLARRLARRLAHARPLRGMIALRHALGSVGGPGGEATSVVLSLGLGLSVLAAIGQIDSNLRGAIARDLPKVAPSYFVIDIQPSQIEGFRRILDKNTEVSKVETAPMLRGVVTKINGRPAKEVAGNHWVVSGDRGVTYAAEIPNSTEVTKGEWWPADYVGEPQISFAAEEAEEIGLDLGDKLTVNILGRDITGTITSFRNVDFSNAGMGFVLTMNPSALSGAPHTYIATIYAEEAAEAAILRDLSNTYPNITAIRVRDVVQRVTEVLGSVAAAITYGALATMVTGVIVLIGAAAAGERARTYEAAILKTVGASRALILRNFALRSIILGTVSGLVAIAAGGLAGWAVMKFVMEADFHFDLVSALSIVAGGVILTVGAGLAFSLSSLNARPAKILRARE